MHFFTTSLSSQSPYIEHNIELISICIHGMCIIRSMSINLNLHNFSKKPLPTKLAGDPSSYESDTKNVNHCMA